MPFALGTDIGGSIRSPAACSGIFGFKPTASRSSNSGIVLPTTSYDMPHNPIKSTAGPLCSSIQDV